MAAWAEFVSGGGWVGVTGPQWTGGAGWWRDPRPGRQQGHPPSGASPPGKGVAQQKQLRSESPGSSRCTAGSPLTSHGPRQARQSPGLGPEKAEPGRGILSTTLGRDRGPAGRSWGGSGRLDNSGTSSRDPGTAPPATPRECFAEKASLQLLWGQSCEASGERAPTPSCCQGRVPGGSTQATLGDHCPAPLGQPKWMSLAGRGPGGVHPCPRCLPWPGPRSCPVSMC